MQTELIQKAIIASLKLDLKEKLKMSRVWIGTKPINESIRDEENPEKEILATYQREVTVRKRVERFHGEETKYESQCY